MTSRQTVAFSLFIGLPAGMLGAVMTANASLRCHVVVADALPPAGPLTAPSSTGLLIAQVAIIVLAAFLVGRLFQRLGQPRVVGEMAAGILLGPSLFGWVAPDAFRTLFNPGTLGGLEALSDIGLVLFMFVVGLDLDTKALRASGRTALVCSAASIAVPFALGVALAWHLYDRLAPSSASFAGFALFLGAAMSITAFPVLARILGEQGLARTRLGTLALAAAAIGDVAAWCILAGIVAVVRAGSVWPDLWLRIAGLVVFVAFMWFAVRPALRMLERRSPRAGHVSTDVLAAMVLVALGSAWVTQALGVHAVFGAFVAGAVMPRAPERTAVVRDRIETVTVLLLLPIFFAITGLRSNLNLFVGPGHLIDLLLVFGVAVLGKFAGASVAARTTGIPWKPALAFGALMNTRGLMELVILKVGLDIGAISPTLFSMMVLMAIVTTMMTTPLLKLLKPPDTAT